MNIQVTCETSVSALEYGPRRLNADISSKKEFPWNLVLMDRNGPTLGSATNTAVLSAILAITYAGLGISISALTGQNEVYTSFAFFPGGLALFFTIVFGIRVWPGIFIGQFALALWSGLPPFSSGAIALIDSLEGVLGSLLFWRWGISRSLSGFRNVAQLFGLIVLILQPFGATAGVLTLFGTGHLPVNQMMGAWFYWWAGHSLGQFLLIAVLLLWTSPVVRFNRWELTKALLLISAYALPLTLFVTGEWGRSEPVFRVVFFASFYLILVILAVQSGLRTMSLANLLMVALFLWMVRAGTNFLIFFSVHDRLLGADLLALAGTFTALLISAIWEELRERREQLREANAAKERLFSVIGHDLSAPVANLKSSLEMLISGSFSPDEFRDLQHELLRGVNHLQQTLRNLMEWGGFQMKSLQPRSGEISLHACAAEALQLLRRIAEEKKIEMENSISKDAMVWADQHQIQSVIRNLLSNALKFTLPGGRVGLSAEVENGFWRVSVRDDGIGMTPERAARLFKIQSEYISTPGTANERGLGLGLQICSNFIQANNGKIWVESALGLGTTFYFTLPIAGVVEGDGKLSSGIKT